MRRIERIRIIARLKLGLRGDLDRIRNYLAAGDRGIELQGLVRDARGRADALTTVIQKLTNSEDDRAIQRAAARLIAELDIVERELQRTQLQN